MDELLNIVKDALEIGLIWSLLALGIFIAFRVLEFADLTAEGAVTMGGAVAASLILKGAPPFIATLLSVAGGFLAGIVTGILHTKLKIPAILSGILTMTGLYSVNLRILGKSAVHLGDAATIYTFPGESSRTRSSPRRLRRFWSSSSFFSFFIGFSGRKSGCRSAPRG